MKAQERHHLKENEFAVQTAWIAEQLAANRTRLLAGVGLVVAVGAIASGYFYMRAQARDRASAMLGAAIAIQQSPIAPPSTVPGATQPAGTYPTEAARAAAAQDALRKVIDAYPSGDTGTAARYFLGTALLAAGNGADAQQAFDQAVATGGSSIYADMARVGLGQALVLQNNYDEAIKTLTDLSAKRDSKLPIDGVLMELARVCRKAGKMQDARAAFKRVVDEFPQSSYVGEARQQLSTMG